MQAIEFETVPENHLIQLPDTAPNGVRMRVLLLWEPPSASSETALKELFSSVTEGLTAADLERQRDFGRRDVERCGVKLLNQVGRFFQREKYGQTITFMSCVL